MTYHYQRSDAEESILTKSLPNLGTWALPNLFFIKMKGSVDLLLYLYLKAHDMRSRKELKSWDRGTRKFGNPWSRLAGVTKLLSLYLSVF